MLLIDLFWLYNILCRQNAVILLFLISIQREYVALLQQFCILLFEDHTVIRIRKELSVVRTLSGTTAAVAGAAVQRGILLRTQRHYAGHLERTQIRCRLAGL